MKKAFLLPFTAIFFLVVIEGAAVLRSEASGNVTIQGFRHWSDERYTRVVVDTDGPIHFTQNRLVNPDRLYFDLKNSRLLKKTDPSLPIEDGILKKVRAGQFKNDTVRVVLDLQRFGNFNAFVLTDPYRLVIDVFAMKDSAPEMKNKNKIPFQEIKRVIIDPGHGGKDPGAIGPKGLREKDVVLDIAKRLGRVLKQKYNMEVTFTRDRDVFVPLEKRTFLANSRKGDLFISIHTNANRKRSTRGIETYFLNWTNNKEAMKVAARENAISFTRMKKSQGELQMILQDLKRQNKKEESMALAHTIQKTLVDTLKKDYTKVVDLGVKYAFFYVLLGAEMPCVLVETSFISNAVEENRLSKKRYRDQLAEAIAKGITDYAAPPKLAKRNGDTF
jgi:N-acetylmuramoyl-L-alanine amidase